MDPSVYLLVIFASLTLGQVSQEPTFSQPVLPQCQCIPDSTGKGCVQYDSRFQAATLDEAMASFPDLTIERNVTDPDPTLEEQAACTTQECLDCRSDLDYKLKKVGLIPLQFGETLTVSNMTTSCKKYKFAGKEEGTYDKDDIKENSEEDSDSDDSDEKEQKEKYYNKEKRKGKKGDRKKRQAAGQTVTIVGQRFTLSCSAKGVATDTTGLVSLCSTCWVWRKLPDNYSPQYINELICDTQDGACLSGYATCGIGHRSIDVVQTVGNVRTTVSISAGSYCECKVDTTSALLSLVTGNTTNPGLPVSLPALNQG